MKQRQMMFANASSCMIPLNLRAWFVRSFSQATGGLLGPGVREVTILRMRQETVEEGVGERIYCRFHWIVNQSNLSAQSPEFWIVPQENDSQTQQLLDILLARIIRWLNGLYQPGVRLATLAI